MREIKFRGRTINGKWVFGDLARYGAAPNCSFISNLDGTFQVIPETVGQYTGLKDQNKVEIY
ncbi:MAG: hypothetical protein JNN05_10620, partial [Candidatus Omnitrophica bacterium]|nr:hypothetical protein [Candidatus Omnitrophota bacterium]